MDSLFLKVPVHPDWENLLTEDMRSLIAEIEQGIKNSNYTPSPEKVLRFLAVPLSSVKIIILGQDPYPQRGVATGRSFEVGNLRSWNKPFNNISLKNILRVVYKAYTGEIIKYNDLKSKFDNEFPVLPPNELFASWEKQGVLLLNTYFTCGIGQPGSHQFIWKDFSCQLLNFIADSKNDIVWFLWGTHAIESVKHLEGIKSVASMHPMMCFDKPGRDTDFLYGKNNCFEQYKLLVNWTGYAMKNGCRQSETLF